MCEGGGVCGVCVFLYYLVECSDRTTLVRV